MILPKPSMREFLAANPHCVMVEIAGARGSTPRDEGTVMLVGESAIWGTIGGGQLEFMAIDNARALLSGAGVATMDIPLGPEIGQCCGGHTRLRFCRVTHAVADELQARLKREEDVRPAVFLFGAGHVGLALVRALAPLPINLTVVESRADAMEEVPSEVGRRLTPMPEASVSAIAPGGAAVILTHDHALDFLIAREALRRRDLRYVGMIGSATKKAVFASWLKRQDGDEPADAERSEQRMSRLVLPIGGGAVKDKRPEVIAALTAAELLTVLFGSAATHRVQQQVLGE